jgi:hypothetical protein
MELLGKIKVLKLNQKVTESYTKSEVVITTDEQYPQHILIEFGGNKSDLLDSYKVGENVKISINIRGREWTSPQGEIKYFNSIQGWRVESTSQAKPQPHESNHPTNMPPKNQAQPQPYNEEEDNDVPF